MPCRCSTSCAALVRSEVCAMSVGTQTAGRVPATSTMSVFERYLSVWVLLCIVAGIALGQFAPNVFQAIGRMEIAQVNLPVGDRKSTRLNSSHLVISYAVF